MILLLLAAAGALYSCLAAFSSIALASPALQMVESWRMYGFLVFGGLFVLLAFWPRHYPGIWELVIFHKAAMAITAATLIASGAPGAQTIALVDGTLAAITLAAYILTKGYTGWARLRVYTLSTRKS
jgi:hypothetical protein